MAGSDGLMGRKVCNYVLREEGKSYPRTCAVCGLGPCPRSGAPVDGRDANDLEPLSRLAVKQTMNGYVVTDDLGRQWIAAGARELGELVCDLVTIGEVKQKQRLPSDLAAMIGARKT